MKISIVHTLIFCLATAACSSTKFDRESTQFSAPFLNGKFNNLEKFPEKGFLPVIKWLLGSKPNSVDWPQRVPVKQVMPLKRRSKNLIVTVISHATVLIQMNNLNILTDPHFSLRASPVQFAGPKRVVDPAIALENLPPIDIVLISHNHYDHLDLDSLKELHRRFRPVVYAGLGTRAFFRENGIDTAVDMDWWEFTGDRGITIRFVPSQHWSGRTLFDRREVLWGGFYISGTSRVYFAGDTGYGKFFKEIKDRLGAPDVALLPIGAYKPRSFMKNHHMNPLDAVNAAIDLQAGSSIGIHFGTFKLTNEGIDEPAKDLFKALRVKSIPPHKFVVPDFGRAYLFEKKLRSKP